MWIGVVVPNAHLPESGSGALQASGEAQYTGDLVASQGDLHAYLVESSEALALLKSIDVSEATRVCAPSVLPKINLVHFLFIRNNLVQLF